ncbi:MAG: heavy metal-binding domain-containing protein, partial [bacterium]
MDHDQGKAPVTRQYGSLPPGFAGTVYTCPMHAQVRNPAPGACPICKMTLVPEGKAAIGHPFEDHKNEPAPAANPKTETVPIAAKSEYDSVPPGFSGTIYTCPMHPQVRQTKSGACPLCGMGLQPEVTSLGDDAPNPELVDFTRRFWVGTLLTVPLLVLTMGPLVGLTLFKQLLGDHALPWV